MGRVDLVEHATVIEKFRLRSFPAAEVFVDSHKIAAKNFYRPRDKDVAAKYAQQFPKLELVTIDKDFGGWKTAQPKFFNDGGVFDQIYTAQ